MICEAHRCVLLFVKKLVYSLRGEKLGVGAGKVKLKRISLGGVIMQVMS